MRALRLAVLTLSCGGCWQEVAYEPEKVTPSTETAAVDRAEQLPPAPSPSSSPDSEILFGNHQLVAPQPVESPTSIPPASEDVATAAIEDTAGEQVDPFLQQLDDNSPEPGDEVASLEPQSSSEEFLPPKAESPEPVNTALAAWQMGSQWSMAAALQAKGRNADNYGERLAQATLDAKQLGIQLPPLPEFEANDDRLPTSLRYLLEVAGPRLVKEVNERHGADHAALAELATKTHVLLLSYTPSSERLEPVVAAIRQAAESSGLPEEVWRELVDLLNARGEFKQVKAAVYQLHRQTIASLQSDGS